MLDFSEYLLPPKPILFIFTFRCSEGNIKLKEVVMDKNTKVVPTTSYKSLPSLIQRPSDRSIYELIYVSLCVYAIIYTSQSLTTFSNIFLSLSPYLKRENVLMLTCPLEREI